MILVLSGVSGAGKTTIARNFIEKFPNSSLVRSYTTRERRESDIPGEYRYLPGWLFWFLEKMGFFIWTVDIFGDRYGTLRRSVKRGLRSRHDVCVMIIYGKVAELLDYARELGSEEFVIPVYIPAPQPDVWKMRLEDEGYNEFRIAKCLKDCKRWDSDASASGLPYIFIRNDLDVSIAVGSISEIVNEKIGEELF